MEYITSKNICLLIRDVLKLTDRRVTDHGSCVGYIVYRMLEATEMFEEFEMAELSFIASLHNIGGYRTDDIGELLQPGYKNDMPHSIYGYLFMKNLFPVPDYGKILLYHHMDYEQLENVDYEFKFMSNFIHLADDAYGAYQTLGDRFDYRRILAGAGKKYSDQACKMFALAVEKYKVFDKLADGSYKEELDQLMDYVLFRDDEKQKYLEMLMHCTAFHSRQVVTDTVTCTCICDELARKAGITPAEKQRLYLGSLLHDIGMLLIPVEIIRKPGGLTKEERAVMQTHVERAEEVLRSRFKDQEVVDIAVRHHERLDGSGYPAKLKGAKMNKPDRILQVADTVCGMWCERTYHKARSIGEVISLLQEEAGRGRLDAIIVNYFTSSSKEIMERVKRESAGILTKYQRIEKQYEAARSKFC